MSQQSKQNVCREMVAYIINFAFHIWIDFSEGKVLRRTNALERIIWKLLFQPIRRALVFYITAIESLLVHSNDSSRQMSDQKSSRNEHVFKAFLSFVSTYDFIVIT